MRVNSNALHGALTKKGIVQHLLSASYIIVDSPSQGEIAGIVKQFSGERLPTRTPRRKCLSHLCQLALGSIQIFHSFKSVISQHKAEGCFCLGRGNMI